LIPFSERNIKNVYATRKPAGEVKRRIIFGGHADAPWEWTYFLHGQMKALFPPCSASIGGMLGIPYTGRYLFSRDTPPLTGFWFRRFGLFARADPFFIVRYVLYQLVVMLTVLTIISPPAMHPWRL
jgi:hypothetical protein